MNTKQIGEYGEIIACNYLKKIGCKIVCKNYAINLGEIDIIAVETKKSAKNNSKLHASDGYVLDIQPNTIVFIEVKDRSTDLFVRASDAVNKRKQMKIQHVAQVFLNESQNKKYSKMNQRYDIIEIVDENINHMIGAF